MNTSYQITKLVWLSKRQQEAADYVAHLSPSESSIDQALSYLRHLFGFEQVAFNTSTRAIVVKGLFVAAPINKPAIL